MSSRTGIPCNKISFYFVFQYAVTFEQCEVVIPEMQTVVFWKGAGQ